jgi:hypothetical protein
VTGGGRAVRCGWAAAGGARAAGRAARGGVGACLGQPESDGELSLNHLTRALQASPPAREYLPVALILCITVARRS